MLPSPGQDWVVNGGIGVSGHAQLEFCAGLPRGIALGGRGAGCAQEQAAQRDVQACQVVAHGHGALATLVLGSITTQVLANSRVPVLVVR